MKIRFFIALIIFSFFPVTASAHPGRTDASGCHTCRTNCAKWGLGAGEYHCHNAKALPQPLPPVTSHETGITEPAPQYAKPLNKPVVLPAVKKESKKVVVPTSKTIATSTPIAQPKVATLLLVEDSWWSKLKKWF